MLFQVSPVPSKKLASEIPTPQFVVVDTYERDYSPTFGQPASYLRARGGLVFCIMKVLCLFNWRLKVCGFFCFVCSSV